MVMRGACVKDRILIAFLVLIGCFIYAEDTEVTLNQAIKGSASYFVERLEHGTKIAILNFSASPALSDYVIEELSVVFVNNGNLIVVDRSELELLQKEIDFQYSGEVSDESAQSIGKKLGAQTILSGSFSSIGNLWRMRIKALEVETAKIQGIVTYSVKKDTVLSSLLPKQPKTIGGKIGTGALNIFLGLGSYLDGDWSGGLTLTGGYAVAVGLFVIEATALDWDNPVVGVPATIGVTVAGLTFVYGFARPFIYNRNPQVAAVLDNFNMAVVPTAYTQYETAKTVGIQLGYSFEF
jgi:hypothetical protein